MSKKKLIIDVDTGTDDAEAIMLALSHPDADVVAITCVYGNTTVDQVCLNTLRVLKVCGRLDIPVYKGVHCAIVGDQSNIGSSGYYHGRDGLGDNPDPEAPTADLVQKEHATSALIRLSKEQPGELTLIALAPLTNIALALRLDPNFGKRLKQAVIMGGNMSAVGNIAPCKEYNFFCDPEAAYVTLNELGCPIRLIPLEPTLTYAMDYEFFDTEIMTLTTPKAMFVKSVSKVVEKNRRESFITVCPVCDASAMALTLKDDIITESSEEYCTVELSGNFTRAQVVVDWKNHLSKKHNVQLVKAFDKNEFKKMYKALFM